MRHHLRLGARGGCAARHGRCFGARGGCTARHCRRPDDPYDGPVDIWFWIVVIVAAALVALVVVGRRAARSRVDPTQVSIDAALAGKVKALYASGDKLRAVKELRAATGLGLADAVRIADKLGATAKPAAPKPAAPGGVPRVADPAAVAAGIGPDHQDELRSLVAAGQAVEAVKRVRQLTGMGLQDAEDYVQRL